MSIIDRIAPILSSIEFQLARSLPVIENGKEILFFYKVKEVDDVKYTISEIKYILFVDSKTGEVKKKNASDILPKSVMDETISNINIHTMDVETELRMEDEYLIWYEKAYEHYVTCGYIEDVIIKNLSVAFKSIIDKTSLKCVYMFLAKDFVQRLE